MKIDKGRLIIAALTIPMFAFILLSILNAFGVGLWLGMKIWPTNWALKVVVHLERPSGDLLLLKADNVRIDSEIEANRLMVISTVDGSIVGERVRDTDFKLHAVTPDLAWCRRSVEQRDMVALQLPDLGERYDLEDLLAAHPEVNRKIDSIRVDGLHALRVDAKGGFQYRLNYADNSMERLPKGPPPQAPDLIRILPQCDWLIPGPVRDSRDCRPMRVGEDEVLAGYQGEGPRRVLYITRWSKDGQAKWSVTEEDLFGPRDDDDLPLYLFFITQAKGRLLIVANDDGQPEDLFLAVVDLRDGSVIWSRVFW